jgi:hypothetical protein
MKNNDDEFVSIVRTDTLDSTGRHLGRLDKDGMTQPMELKEDSSPYDAPRL